MPFSYSQLNTYSTCPKQFEFANVKKIPRQISAGESFGSSVHNTLSKWGKLEAEKGKKKEEKDQLTMFEEPEEEAVPLTIDLLLDLWHQSFIVQGYSSKVDADSARTKGEVLMQKFYEWWEKETREVIAIEKGFSIAVDIDTIKGRFDRIERTAGKLIVIDYKTGGMRTQEEVDEDLQLSIYALACQDLFGEPCDELVLFFLSEEGITEVVTKRTPKQLSKAGDVIGSLSEQIDDEKFTATPSESACRRCPYRSICENSAV
ncbi:MAG: PD-(D/E)XK nuclease family protein [Candidatus Peribacter sp.]|nr:PD-(D/E)XK nuclease family protein [Candidatus Peribacter sp.]MBT4393338.1 PD-(D/E)XK nuclease family protein [Candidatus Peribacter sp.]MBT4600823.1 PD-(D/E)XK nuclease family protein [Candidatus Peribacter sp.]MBT5149131.1 PD-(D/E)XK nuclease family protein [Candidatus Peribacter sp.]MBT5637896.1 PD-(D/E)XK nuclease family protein [Candidatus Peribacter sp.]